MTTSAMEMLRQQRSLEKSALSGNSSSEATWMSDSDVSTDAHIRLTSRSSKRADKRWIKS